MNKFLEFCLALIERGDGKRIRSFIRTGFVSEGYRICDFNPQALNHPVVLGSSRRAMEQLKPAIQSISSRFMLISSPAAAEALTRFSNSFISSHSTVTDVELSMVSGLHYGKAAQWLPLDDCKNLPDLGRLVLASDRWPDLWNKNCEEQRAACEAHIAREFGMRPISMITDDWHGRLYLSTEGGNSHLAALAALGGHTISAKITQHSINWPEIQRLDEAGVSLWVAPSISPPVHSHLLYRLTSGRVSESSLGTVHTDVQSSVFWDGPASIIALDHRARYSNAVATAMTSACAEGYCQRFDAYVSGLQTSATRHY